MKRNFLILITMFCLSASGSVAAEKSPILVKLDASRTAVEALATRTGENREAAAELEQARSFLKKATDAHDKGRQLLGFNIGGFGTLKPEAEEEIKNHLEMSDLSVAIASSQLEKARAARELEGMEKQLASVKAKIKVMEDRKTELEKMKAEAVKCQTAAKELEGLKAEKALLTSRVAQLVAESSKIDKQKAEQADLSRKFEDLKTENTRLAGQTEKQLAEIKSLTSQLAEAKKAAAK